MTRTEGKTYSAFSCFARTKAVSTCSWCIGIKNCREWFNASWGGDRMPKRDTMCTHDTNYLWRWSFRPRQLRDDRVSYSGNMSQNWCPLFWSGQSVAHKLLQFLVPHSVRYKGGLTELSWFRFFIATKRSRFCFSNNGLEDKGSGVFVTRHLIPCMDQTLHSRKLASCSAAYKISGPVNLQLLTTENIFAASCITGLIQQPACRLPHSVSTLTTHGLGAHSHSKPAVFWECIRKLILYFCIFNLFWTGIPLVGSEAKIMITLRNTGIVFAKERFWCSGPQNLFEASLQCVRGKQEISACMAKRHFRHQRGLLPEIIQETKREVFL